MAFVIPTIGGIQTRIDIPDLFTRPSRSLVPRDDKGPGFRTFRLHRLPNFSNFQTHFDTTWDLIPPKAFKFRVPHNTAPYKHSFKSLPESHS